MLNTKTLASLAIDRITQKPDVNINSRDSDRNEVTSWEPSRNFSSGP